MIRVEFNLPSHVKLSEKRRKQYYRVGDKIPKRYASLSSDSAGFLIDANGERIVSNPRAQGTPKLWPINGQHIMTGMHHAIRHKVFTIVKESLEEQVRDLFPDEKYPTFMTPVSIEMEYHELRGQGNWDLDNKTFLWYKWIIDVFKGKFFPEDNIDHVQQIGPARWIPAKSEDERKLVIIIRPLNELEV